MRAFWILTAAMLAFAAASAQAQRVSPSMSAPSMGGMGSMSTTPRFGSQTTQPLNPKEVTVDKSDPGSKQKKTKKTGDRKFFVNEEGVIRHTKPLPCPPNCGGNAIRN